MEIKGKKYLDANWYNRIVLMERNGDIECNVSTKEKIKNFIENNSTISNDIDKYSSNSEKCLEIVNYFLRYGTVNKLEEYVEIPNNYTNKFIRVTTDERELYLSINADKNANKIINSIINKYYLDQYKKVYETLNIYDIGHIDIRKGKQFSYEIYDDSYYDINEGKYIETGKKSISIKYLRNFKKEQDFILSLVKYLGKESPIVFLKEGRRYRDDKEEIYGFRLHIGEMNMYCDNLSLLDDIGELVKKSNEEYLEKESSKKFQLKMEGLF